VLRRVGSLGGSCLRQHAADVAAAASQSDGDQPFEFTARTISAVVIAFLVASLAASAGVGGGAFFVPLYMLALGFGEGTGCCLIYVWLWPVVSIRLYKAVC
jgi:uncharacterized membrane protein YfcA